MKTIEVTFSASTRRYAYNTARNVAVGDKLKVRNADVTVAKVYDEAFTHVDRSTGELSNEPTENAVPIATL